MIEEPADPFSEHRIESLFPEFQADCGAVLYENDIEAGLNRCRDHGLLSRLGISGDTISADAFDALIHPDDLGARDRFYARRAELADNEVIAMTLRLKAATGDWRHVNFRARVLSRNETGEPRRMLGLAMDITDHNALGQAINEARGSIVEATAEERQRIGRDLHDSTGQHLLAISLALRGLERRLPASPAVKAVLDDLRASVEAARLEVRVFSYLLHPPELAQFGLAAALAKLCTGFGRRAGLKVDFSVTGDPGSVADESVAAIYRIAQEALMNAFRRAKATTVSLNLIWSPSALILEVADNGPCTSDGAGVHPTQEAGVGSRSIRERIEEVGGALDFGASSPGYRVVARAPLASGEPSVLPSRRPIL